jgi:precorrin isomerase
MEIRIEAGFHAQADVDAQIARVQSAMAEVSEGERVVIVADWRKVPIMPAPAAERAHKLLTTTSDRIERSGILASPNSPTALMQFFRLVRESEHPSRRVVTSLTELEDWVAPVLSHLELKRMREFLAETS